MFCRFYENIFVYSLKIMSQKGTYIKFKYGLSTISNIDNLSFVFYSWFKICHFVNFEPEIPHNLLFNIILINKILTYINKILNKN